MYKINKITKKTYKDKDSVVSTVYDNILTSIGKNIYRLIFALANALKITPKRLANAYKVEKTDDYAVKFREELRKKIEKTIAESEKKTSK